MHAADKSPGMSPVRLTRRGRVVVVAAVLAVLMGALWVGTGRSVTASPGPVVPAGRELTWVRVERGDTLWGIASELVPGRDPAPMVDEIMRINRLPDTLVRPGMRLYVPRARHAGWGTPSPAHRGVRKSPRLRLA